MICHQAMGYPIHHMIDVDFSNIRKNTMNIYEYDYTDPDNLRQAAKLTKKYMGKALAKARKMAKKGGESTSVNTHSMIADMDRFYKRENVSGIYIYPKNGGWYADMRLVDDGDGWIIGTPNANPHPSKKKAESYAIQALASVIAYEEGNMKLKDESGVPEGCTDFRLYNDRYNFRLAMIDGAKQHLLSMIEEGCEYDSSEAIDEAKNLIHQQMALPDSQRDIKGILAAMIVLMTHDIHVVNYPIGWNGEGTDLINDLLMVLKGESIMH
jgi:hypothetical protein